MQRGQSKLVHQNANLMGGCQIHSTLCSCVTCFLAEAFGLQLCHILNWIVHNFIHIAKVSHQGTVLLLVAIILLHCHGYWLFPCVSHHFLISIKNKTIAASLTEKFFFWGSEPFFPCQFEYAFVFRPSFDQLCNLFLKTLGSYIEYCHWNCVFWTYCISASEYTQARWVCLVTKGMQGVISSGCVTKMLKWEMCPSLLCGVMWNLKCKWICTIICLCSLHNETENMQRLASNKVCISHGTSFS